MSGRVKGGGGRGRGPGDGDWICPEPECGSMNFARRTACHRCGIEKKVKNTKKMGVEIGAGLAEKSNGLFSAEDWQCGKCGNVNWARRSTCNVCNGPKFSVEEERTGLGGGFNERGIVEYKEYHSDDEFDDFGRRKKKGTSRHSVFESAEQGVDGTAVDQDPVIDDEEEEEEEEEEEDDGDLSKYDLWGDAADDKNKDKDDNKKKKSKSRSRSRSRSKKKSRRDRSSSSSSSRSRSRSKKKSKKRRSRSSNSSSSNRSRSRSKKRSSRRRSSSRSGGKKRSRSHDKKSKKRSRRSSSSSSSSSSSGSSRSRSRERSRLPRFSFPTNALTCAQTI